MREILFRGKRKDNGEWVEGNLFVPDLPDTPTQICIGTNVIRITYDIIPETVGQFTGLTDKNGKKIFEGDILLVKTTLDSINKVTRDDEYTANGVVVFNEGHFELEGKGLVLCTYWGVKALFAAARFKEYEVIGNVHDNPELLKQKEECKNVCK